jgi:putative sigma-54 modulation protein
MKVLIHGVHIRLTARLKKYVETHLVAPLQRFYDDTAAEIDVHLCDINGPKGGIDKECRVTVRIPRRRSMHVTETSDDLYKAIDFARDRVERAAKREISRRRERSAHEGEWAPM